jgi:hypothetical protein
MMNYLFTFIYFKKIGKNKALFDRIVIICLMVQQISPVLNE